VICGGMGAGAARRATATVINEFAPSRVVSVGFAGALDRTLKVGEVFEPRIVINAKDGSRTDTGSGDKLLVSYDFVAGKGQKSSLHKAYGASAVDMEAAAVAQGAQAAGVQFAALKAVSDAADSDMPPMAEFVGDNGQFYSSRFVVYVAAHPRLWGMTFALARNTSKASRALSAAIIGYLQRENVSHNGN
jgi:adenosylhomocysteine nucleosidase